MSSMRRSPFYPRPFPTCGRFWFIIRDLKKSFFSGEQDVLYGERGGGKSFALLTLRHCHNPNHRGRRTRRITLIDKSRQLYTKGFPEQFQSKSRGSFLATIWFTYLDRDSTRFQAASTVGIDEITHPTPYVLGGS